MYKKKGLIVNVHGESKGGVKQDEIKTGFSIEDAEKLGIPGFRSEDQIEKFKNLSSFLHHEVIKSYSSIILSASLTYFKTYKT